MKPPPPPGKLRATPAALKSAIAERDEILEWMTAAKEREMVLRKFIAAQLFPHPNEGTNRVTVAGLEAKMVYDIARKVDEAALDLHKNELIRRGVPVNRVIEMNPTLVMKEYRALTEPHRKLFDRVLIIKPSETPKLEINAAP